MFPRLRERSGQLAGSLSGGEQQMCAIGRALMAEPTLLMLDEPSLGLAPILVEQVMRTITDLHAAGITVLLVEQNLRKAPRDRAARDGDRDGAGPARGDERRSSPRTPRSARRTSDLDHPAAWRAIPHRALYQESPSACASSSTTASSRRGRRIDERALVERFGISRTPLREALKVLHAEGLVRLTPRRGSCVAGELTPQDLDEIFPLMALLEGLCAFEAVKKATPTTCGGSDALHARLERHAAAGDVDRYYELNYGFHEAVQELAANPWLSRTVSELRRFLRLLRGRQLRVRGRLGGLARCLLGGGGGGGGPRRGGTRAPCPGLGRVPRWSRGRPRGPGRGARSRGYEQRQPEAGGLPRPRPAQVDPAACTTCTWCSRCSRCPSTSTCSSAASPAAVDFSFSGPQAARLPSWWRRAHRDRRHPHLPRAVRPLLRRPHAAGRLVAAQAADRPATSTPARTPRTRRPSSRRPRSATASSSPR